ncbi:hypothetical protein B0H16DRAFT_1693788 [Mycena metata]|uniref:Uncharacterized protein n=1 Tax=Mycena metata TaxID=1033252 RepID=A0AAD7IGJ7_9AGAR|nr:hypothetical protein B0H16DRAFT_1693788 [Mycena metata]
MAHEGGRRDSLREEALRRKDGWMARARARHSGCGPARGIRRSSQVFERETLRSGVCERADRERTAKDSHEERINVNNSKPISSCDFQPVPFKKARPVSSSSDTTTGDRDKDKYEREREQADRRPCVTTLLTRSTASHYTPSNLAKLQPAGQMIDILHGLPARAHPAGRHLCPSTRNSHSTSSFYGFQCGAIRKWALESDCGDGDFPKRGILPPPPSITAHRTPLRLPEFRPLVFACLVAAAVLLLLAKTPKSPTCCRVSSPTSTVPQRRNDARSHVMAMHTSFFPPSSFFAACSPRAAGTDTDTTSILYFLKALTCRHNENDPRAPSLISSGTEYLNAGSVPLPSRPSRSSLTSYQVGVSVCRPGPYAAMLPSSLRAAGSRRMDGGEAVRLADGESDGALRAGPCSRICGGVLVAVMFPAAMECTLIVLSSPSVFYSTSSFLPVLLLYLMPSTHPRGQGNGASTSHVGEGNRAWARARRRARRVNGSGSGRGLQRWISLGRLHRRWEEREQEWDRQSPLSLRGNTMFSPRPCSRPRTLPADARGVQAVDPCTRARELFVCSPRQHTSGDVLRVRAAVPHPVRGRTIDTVAIYDTQQAGPVRLLTKLLYDGFTDLTRSPDGQCLMLSSHDGCCRLVTFDEFLPTHHTQQPAFGSHTSGGGSQAGVRRKRPLELLTPAASVDADRERERDVVISAVPFACIKKHPPLLLCLVKSRRCLEEFILVDLIINLRSFQVINAIIETHRIEN